jgi:hypothetical protein
VTQTWKLLGGSTVTLDDTRVTLHRTSRRSAKSRLVVPLTAVTSAEVIGVPAAGPAFRLNIAGDDYRRAVDRLHEPTLIILARQSEARAAAEAINRRLRPDAVADPSTLAALARLRTGAKPAKRPYPAPPGLDDDDSTAQMNHDEATTGPASPVPVAAPRAEDVGYVQRKKYLLTGPTPKDPAERVALSMAAYERIAVAANVALEVRPAPHAGLGLGGRGLGLGQLESEHFGCFGDWYSDAEGLYMHAPPVIPGLPLERDLIPMMMPGAPTLLVQRWADVTGILIDGQEATSTTFAVTGRQRGAFHVLGSKINESATSEAEANALVVFERREGADLVLNLWQASPREVRTDLAAGMAKVRQQMHLEVPTGSAAAGLGLADELTKLGQLVAQGLLTQEEFAAQKVRLLSA